MNYLRITPVIFFALPGCLNLVPAQAPNDATNEQGAPAPPPNMTCPVPAPNAGDDYLPKDRHFTPIPSAELLAGDYLDTVVFMGITERAVEAGTSNNEDFGLSEVSDQDYTLAGEPVTLCYVYQTGAYHMSAEGEAEYAVANFAVVMTSDKKRRWVDTRYLSSAPLSYRLSKPGTALELTKGMLREVLLSTQAQKEVVEAGHYDVNNLSVLGASGPEVNEVSRQHMAFAKVTQATQGLLQGMARGAYDRGSIMGDAEYKWVVDAKDPKVLDWFSGEGASDPVIKDITNMSDCAARRVGVAYEAIAPLAQQLKDKAWRQNVNGSEAQLAKLDETEGTRIQRDIDMMNDATVAAFDNKECQAARAFLGD